MATAPEDAEKVLWAVRLGWYVAEVRGRNRPNGPMPHESELPSRADHALPLRFERTTTESRIEAQATVEALAKNLLVDKNPADSSVNVERVHELAKQLHDWQASDNDAAAKSTWNQLAELLFKLDAYIQDTLTARSDTQACGYQMGRGLSESYWALDIEPPPQPPGTPTSSEEWTFLLGELRCSELSRLAGRLSGYFRPYACAAVSGALTAWSEVAKDQAWRQVDETHSKLYLQHRRWYDLIVMLQDPSTLIKPYSAIANLSALWRGARALKLQLLLALGSLVGVLFLISYLSAGTHSVFSKALIGFLSAIGISATTVTTRLKNAAQALTTRFKQDVYTDLITVGVAIIPARPGAWTGSQRRDLRVRRAVKRRVITIETPPPA
jgi:hypothetical protein